MSLYLEYSFSLILMCPENMCTSVGLFYIIYSYCDFGPVIKTIN